MHGHRISRNLVFKMAMHFSHASSQFSTTKKARTGHSFLSHTGFLRYLRLMAGEMRTRVPAGTEMPAISAMRTAVCRQSADSWCRWRSRIFESFCDCSSSRKNSRPVVLPLPQPGRRCSALSRWTARRHMVPLSNVLLSKILLTARGMSADFQCRKGRFRGRRQSPDCLSCTPLLPLLRRLWRG